MVLLEEEDAEVEEGLRVRAGERGLGGDGLAVGGDGVFGLAEALVGEAEIVARLDVGGVEVKAGKEGLAGVVGAVEIVVDAAEEVPGVGARGAGAGGEEQPALGVGEVLEQDVVRGDEGEFFGGGRAELCGVGEGGEGVCGAILAEERGAEQEAGFGIGGGGGDEGAEAGLGGGEVAVVKQRAGLLEGSEGEGGDGLGGGVAGEEEG